MIISHKWVKWIDTCLKSSMVFMLVNGSPSKEFSIQEGLPKRSFSTIFIHYCGQGV